MTVNVLYVDTLDSLEAFDTAHSARMSPDIVFSTASSGDEALRLLSREAYDAVVAAYELPGMGGIELLKAVRAGTGHIPFILVSARGSEQVFRDAMAAGVDFYIHKSSAPDTFFSDLDYKIKLVIRRQRSEQALAGSEELFRTAFDHAQTGMALTAPDGGLIRVNEKLTLMLDLSEDELKASTLIAHVHTDDFPGIMEQIEAALRDGIDTIDCELRFVHRDGSIIFTRIHSILIRDADGQPRYFLTSITDITSYKKIEDELKDQKEQYQAVVESQSEFICRFLPDGTHVFANEAYCRYFGKSRDEIVDSRFIPEIPAEDRRFIRAHLDALTPEHPYGSIRHRIIMPDGSVRWQRWNDMAIFDDAGSLVQYQSVGRDITGIIAAEEALRESEVFYRTIFEHTGTASIIVAPDFGIVLANSEFERLSGYTRAELEGKMQWTVFVAEECLEKMKHYHLSRRRDPGSAPIRYTFTFIDRAGTRKEILLTVGVIGDSGLSIASLLDITRSRKLEADLIESRRELAVTLDATTDGIWKWDFITDTLDFSSRYYEMLGYEPGEFAATFKSWIGMLHPDDRDRATRRFTDYRNSGGDAYENDFRLRTKDGSYRWIHAKARVVARDREGNPLRIIGNHEDVTDRKNAELALAEVNKKLHLLSGITRHDILNQVMILSGFLTLFENSGAASGPETADYLGEIKKAVTTITAQIEFTRDYEELGIQVPCWQDVPSMVRTAAAAVLPGSVTLEVATGPLEVYADPLLERVVFNLLQNSVMHGEHVSKVTVSFAESLDDDHGTLVIADNGVGVPANRKEEIFRYGVGRHTGFGLFLVREILGITRMTIRETGEEGQGVRFEIVVPGEAYRGTAAMENNRQGSGAATRHRRAG